MRYIAMKKENGLFVKKSSKNHCYIK